jgi:NTP pyrophosphatase (non-canonical NTP hydrolase)
MNKVRKEIKSDLKELTKLVVDFRDDRDWKQFHNPKDLALSLVLEATEVMEHFQWKSPKEMYLYIKTNKEEIGDELADVMYWVLLMSNDLEIDIAEALKRKILKNNKKYPVEKATGKHDKYTKL